MFQSENPWVTVLAGGDGRRLFDATACEDGTFVPKQFWPFSSVGTMCDAAVELSSRLTLRRRTQVMVQRKHRRWWTASLAGSGEVDLVVQPENRGTALAILVATLRAFAREPGGVLVAIPANHYAGRPDLLAAALRTAARTAEESGAVVLLAVHPRPHDYGCDWVVPVVTGDGADPHHLVMHATRENAAELMQAGGLRVTGMFAASLRTLIRGYMQTVPWMLDAYHDCARDDPSWSPATLARFYRSIPGCAFLGYALRRFPSPMQVQTVDECDWRPIISTQDVRARGEGSLGPRNGGPGFRQRRGVAHPGASMTSRFDDGPAVVTGGSRAERGFRKRHSRRFEEW